MILFLLRLHKIFLSFSPQGIKGDRGPPGGPGEKGDKVYLSFMTHESCVYLSVLILSFCV